MKFSITIDTTEPGGFKRFRQSLGLSQSEMAKSLGLSQSAVRKWERGETKPSPRSWVKIAGVAFARGAVVEGTPHK